MSTPLHKRNGAKVVLKARNPDVADIVLENDAEYSTKYRAAKCRLAARKSGQGMT